MVNQSREEREALDATWKAHPAVVEFTEQVEANAWRNHLDFDIEGMNASLTFALAWQREHGPLSDSGILSG